MRLRRTLGQSIRALSAQKTRAILALSSIAVGVAAVVVTSALGTGAQRELSLRMQSMGTNLLIVRPAQVERLVARKTIRGLVTSLKPGDYEAIQQLPLIATAAPGIEGAARVKASNSAILTKVLGTTGDLAQIRLYQLTSGRFLDDADDRESHRVCVLGARVAQALFRGEDAVGRDVRIRGVPFRIIGVLEARGVLADGSDEDNQVFIPIRTALRRVFNSTWLNTVFVSVRDPTEMRAATDAIRSLLRARHRLAEREKPDDFGIQNTVATLSAQQRIVRALAYFGTGLAAGALVVGGMGILALMFLSLKERTAEIGLRMAIGARPRDILAQFLLEATALAGGGWIVGMTLGGAVALAIAAGTDWKVGVPVGASVASLVMAVVTGLGAGALPAHKASLIPPMQALRSA